MADKTPAKINVGQRILDLTRQLRPDTAATPSTRPQVPTGKQPAQK
jgi:hypothetical protein